MTTADRAEARTELDHLVVVADSLDQGVAWCEATLGVVPGPGGRHALMGTHNRLLRIDSTAFPRAYLEIIAVDPEAPPPARPRWFGMDSPALKAAVKREPQLHHAVLRCTGLDALRQALLAQGEAPGDAVAAERATPQGLLRWRILLRADGRIGAAGALPTLIEWAGPHPSEAMAPSPLRLRDLVLRSPGPACQAVLRPRALRWAEPPPSADTVWPPCVAATLDTPRGPVTLDSGAL